MKLSKLFITVAGVSFAFGVTSIAYADTPFLRQEQLQEQKIQHAISASRSTAQLTTPIALEQAVEVDPSIQDLSSTAFFVQEILVDDNLEEFSFLEDMTASYMNQEVTLADVTKLLSAMNQKLSDKGYVTSRVVIPEQNVSERSVSFETAGRTHGACGLCGRLQGSYLAQCLSHPRRGSFECIPA